MEMVKHGGNITDSGLKYIIQMVLWIIYLGTKRRETT